MLSPKEISRARAKRYIYPCALAVCVIIIAWQYVSIVNYEIRLAFALDQVEIFHEFVNRTTPGDQRSSESLAEAVRNYYPSGTKQTSGSQIDRIVETSRQCALDAIMKMASCDANDADGEPSP